LPIARGRQAAPVWHLRAPAGILSMSSPEPHMRFHTYTKFSPELGDAVDLQSLLDKLADFLLQSGFADGGQPHYGMDMDGDGDRSLDALRQAILNALLESGQFTPEMLEALRGDGDEEGEAKLARLLDQLVQRLIEEGYLKLDAPPQMPGAHQPVEGKGSIAHAASRDVQFDLTEKGIDFLGYKTLRNLLGSLGKSSFGSHDTPYLATGIEADAATKPYEFGDVLNLDVNETLTNALARTGTLGVPLAIEYADLAVRQAEYRSSCATVLMLDCSHSMILYGEDRFTPAKKVALALTHLIRTQFPGDTLKVVLFHDSAEEIPLAALAKAQVGPYHTNTAEGLKMARRLLLAQKKDMRQIIMITDGKPSALTMPNGQIYKNSFGLDATVISTTLREVANCRRSGIMINTFMLARDRALVEFVKRVSEISRGKAYFTTTMTLGQFILMDFLKRKTRTVS
jgi:Ca-activated chloride channel family protein